MKNTYTNNNIDKYFDSKKRCQFQEWYPLFKSITFSSVIIPLPKIFIDYLGSDIFTTDEHSFPQYSGINEADKDFHHHDNWSSVTYGTEHANLNKDYYQGYSDDDDDDEETEESEDDDNDQDNNNNNKKDQRIIKESEFPQLIDSIKDAIKKLGGDVIPKLNWSSPKDAMWMNAMNSLRCSSPTDIFLLLKSSDFINHDLSQFKINAEDSDESLTPYHLVLRKWHNLYQSMEFRCFVKNNELIGISQRDTSSYFNFLKDKKLSLQSSITEFYNQNIKDKFTDTSYSFDVYITKENKVWLVDFNPIHPSTDALLFIWDELFPELIEDDDDNEVEDTNNHEEKVKPVTSLEFRIVENENGIKPNLSMTSRLPLDLLQMQSTNNQEISDILDKFKDNLK
eukprot:gene7406-9101_t